VLIDARASLSNETSLSCNDLAKTSIEHVCSSFWSDEARLCHGLPVNDVACYLCIAIRFRIEDKLQFGSSAFMRSKQR
jgi:hypothetical protein